DAHHVGGQRSSPPVGSGHAAPAAVGKVEQPAAPLASKQDNSSAREPDRAPKENAVPGYEQREVLRAREAPPALNDPAAGLDSVRSDVRRLEWQARPGTDTRSVGHAPNPARNTPVIATKELSVADGRAPALLAASAPRLFAPDHVKPSDARVPPP